MKPVLAVLLSALVLAGCYISKQPLIVPAAADYPIADAAHFDAYTPAGSGWRKLVGRTVRRAGGYYVYVEDGRPKPSLPFLLKRVAPNLYVAQLSDRASGEFAYELIRFAGTPAIQYHGTCPARADWLRRRLIDRIENAATPRCIFSNFESLTIVLREAVKNAAPEAKYVLTQRR